MAFQWYILNTFSGFEKKVAQAIKEQAAQKELSHLFEDVTVPVESVVEVRRGQKVGTEKKIFPGYVLVKMEMNDDSWHLVKSIPRVTGFLGGKGVPQPVSEAEMSRIFKQIEEGIQNPKQTVSFEAGESVKIIDGPFESFVGVVEEVDNEKSRLKVAVTIFGRSTPVDLEFAQVEAL